MAMTLTKGKGFLISLKLWYTPRTDVDIDTLFINELLSFWI